MTSPERQVHHVLVATGFSRDAAFTRGARYRGCLAVSGRSVRCEILFDDFEFARLPRLTLTEPTTDVPELIAHLELDDGYCYANRDQFVLDRYAPREAVLQSLQLMRASLERSLTRHAQREIEAEFPQHWFGDVVYLDLPPNFVGRSATLYNIRRRNGPSAVLLSDTLGVARLFPELDPKNGRRVGIVRTPKILTYSEYHSRPATLGAFLEWLAHIDSSAAAGALDRLQCVSTSPRTVFVVAPNGVVGAQVDIPPIWTKAVERPVALARFIDKRRQTLGISRMIGEPVDSEFLYSRNLPNKKSLAGLRITLIGCGTIGSHLAKMLAQSGAGHGPTGSLTLVDEQELKPGNIGRHLLGVPHIGYNKAVAVRDELMRLYPNLSITAVASDALKRLSNLRDNDLVIEATGDEGFANAVNASMLKLLNEQGTVPTVLYVWLFGNGAAAQSLLWDGEAHACYRCLKPAHGAPWRFSPLKSEYQTQEVPAQCGEGAFLPYGVSSSLVAASLGLQTIIDWINGDPSPRLRTQVISKNETQQVKDRDPQRSPNCPACGEKAS